MFVYLYRLAEKYIDWLFAKHSQIVESCHWASSSTKDIIGVLLGAPIAVFHLLLVGFSVGLLITSPLACKVLIVVACLEFFVLPLLMGICKGVKEYWTYRFGTPKEKKEDAFHHALDD